MNNLKETKNKFKTWCKEHSVELMTGTIIVSSMIILGVEYYLGFEKGKKVMAEGMLNAVGLDKDAKGNLISMTKVKFEEESMKDLRQVTVEAFPDVKYDLDDIRCLAFVGIKED